MEKMPKLVSLLLVLSYLHIKAGNSELIVFPRDTEVLFNQSTYFNCSTSIVNATIHWNHYRVGENITNYVYYKRQFNKFYSDRYSIAIDNRTGRYDLIIRSVQPEDAGRYECRDFEGLGIHRSAKLIVLDFPPRCQSNMKPGGFVGSKLSVDELQLSCSVSYSGSIPPTLQWTMEGSDTPITNGIVVDNSVKTVTVNLTKSLDIELNNVSFTCSATRSHDGQSICTTDQVQVNCTYVEEETTKELFLLILIPIVAALLIISIVLFLKRQKVKFECVERETPKQDSSESLLHQTIRFAQVDKHNATVKTCKLNSIITIASKEMEKAITGVAILEGLLYIVSERSSKIEIFDSKSFELRKRHELDELESPWDMVSCKLNKCLYIMDRRSAGKSNHVVRVDSDVKASVQWSTGEEYGNLSITREGHVVVTFCDSRKLFIYDPDGNRLNVMSLSEDFIHPSHALKLSKPNGHFLLSYGLDKDNVHRVCVIGENGEIQNNSLVRMESPCHLALDNDGVVFVAYQGNSRVCALNSDLELIGKVASQRNGLRRPQKICLDAENRKLFIANNEVLAFKRRWGKLMIFIYKL